VYLPISPDVLAIFCWSNCRGYLQMTKWQVADNNRMIQSYSNRWFASPSPKASLYWFSRYPLDPWFMIRLCTTKFTTWVRLKFNRYVRR